MESNETSKSVSPVDDQNLPPPNPNKAAPPASRPASPFPVFTKLSGLARMKAIAYGGPEAARYQVRDTMWLDDPQPNWRDSWDDGPDKTPEHKRRRPNNPGVDETRKGKNDPVAEEKRQKERDEKMKQLHLDIKDAGEALYQTERDLEAILKEVTAIKKERIFWVLVGTKTVEQLQFTKASLDKTVQELTDMLELARAFHARVVRSPQEQEIEQSLVRQPASSPNVKTIWDSKLQKVVDDRRKHEATWVVTKPE